LKLLAVLIAVLLYVRFADIHSRAAQERRYHSVVKAGGIILDAYGVGLLVEGDAANAIDLRDMVKPAEPTLSGRGNQAEADIYGGH
jgi:hypothetical protein